MYIIDVHHFKSRLLLCGEHQTIDLNLNKRNFGFRCVKKNSNADESSMAVYEINRLLFCMTDSERKVTSDQ